MEHQLLSILKKAFQATLTIVALIFLGRYVYFSWEDVNDVPFTINVAPLAIAIFFLFIFYYLYSQSWQRLLYFFSRDTLQISRLALHRIFFVSFLARYLPAGKLLNIGSRIELLKQRGGSRTIGFKSVFYEQMYLIGGVAFLAWASFLTYPSQILPTWIERYRTAFILGGSLFCLLWFITPSWIVKFAVRLMGDSIASGSKPKWGINQHVEVFLRFSIVNLAQGCAALCILWAVYPRLPSLNCHFLVIIAAYPVSRFLGQMAVILPGGIGIREGAFAFLLGSYLPVQQLLLGATLMRLICILLELGIAGILLVLSRMRPDLNGGATASLSQERHRK